MLFSFFHPSQTLFCTYHSLLAILNFPQLCMAFWSERHVMQLSSPTLADCLLALKIFETGLEILNVCFFQVSMCCLLSLSVVAALMSSYFRLIARKSNPRTLVVRHHRSLCR